MTQVIELKRKCKRLHFIHLSPRVKIIFRNAVMSKRVKARKRDSQEPQATQTMPLSTGDESGAILPQANKCRLNAVVREAAFRRSREQGSETPYIIRRR
jgi:hypothetical protein